MHLLTLNWRKLSKLTPCTPYSHSRRQLSSTSSTNHVTKVTEPIDKLKLNILIQHQTFLVCVFHIPVQSSRETGRPHTTEFPPHPASSSTPPAGLILPQGQSRDY